MYVYLVQLIALAIPHKKSNGAEMIEQHFIVLKMIEYLHSLNLEIGCINHRTGTRNDRTGTPINNSTCQSLGR